MKVWMGFAAAGLLAAGLGIESQAQDASSQAGKPAANQAPAPARAGEFPPRAAPTDYQSHAQAGQFTIAAEFMGHGVPTEEGGPYQTEDYVVVETGVYGKPGAKLTLSFQDFSLRLNNKKQPAPSVSYLEVFKSLKDPEWQPPEPQKNSKTTIGGGDNPQDGDLPPVIHMPMELRHAMEQRVLKASFPEGERALPQAGLLFFEYHGSLKNVRSMELIYNGAAGQAAIPLRQ